MSSAPNAQTSLLQNPRQRFLQTAIPEAFDAIYAQRPLLEVLREHGCDYLFQLKENQGYVYDAANTEPGGASLRKKRENRGSQVVVRLRQRRGSTNKMVDLLWGSFGQEPPPFFANAPCIK